MPGFISWLKYQAIYAFICIFALKQFLNNIIIDWMRKLSLVLIVLGFSLSAFKTTAQEKTDEIIWFDFEKAVLVNDQPEHIGKKFFIDVYTHWCGWCTRMDQTTFKDSAVIAILNKYFLPVKLDAERKDTVVYDGQTFVNPNPGGSRSSHQLASSLLKGQMSYPSFVLLNEKEEMIQILKGYRNATDLIPILLYFGEDIYLTKTWQEYQESMKK